MTDEQRATVKPREGSSPAKAERRAWSTKEDEAAPEGTRRSGSLWDRFLHLMGIVGPDRRGGPGG